MNNGFLQGDLQALFDALYSVGVIDPVLKMDWSKVNEEMVRDPKNWLNAVHTVNSCQGNPELLIEKMQNLDHKSLHCIAVEVAREFAEFQDRKELH